MEETSLLRLGLVFIAFAEAWAAGVAWCGASAATASPSARCDGPSRAGAARGTSGWDAMPQSPTKRTEERVQHDLKGPQTRTSGRNASRGKVWFASLLSFLFWRGVCFLGGGMYFGER